MSIADTLILVSTICSYTWAQSRIEKRQQNDGIRDIRLLQMETSSSGLSIGAIIGIVIGVVLLGIGVHIFLRRRRLESRRKETQLRMDRVLREGTGQTNTPLQEHLLEPRRLDQVPQLPTHSDLGTLPTPIEHVVGSTDSDDFVIMGAGKPNLGKTDFAKMNKAGMQYKTSTKQQSKLEELGSHTGSSFAASYVSDDIAMLQSTRGGSFDVVVIDPKGHAI